VVLPKDGTPAGHFEQASVTNARRWIGRSRAPTWIDSLHGSQAPRSAVPPARIKTWQHGPDPPIAPPDAAQGAAPSIGCRAGRRRRLVG
jgi:hypothetical protein